MSRVWREIRRLWKAVEGARQRRDETMIEGVVRQVKGARVKVEYGTGENGQPLVSPWLRIPAHTGKRQGGVSQFTKYGLGESVLIVSPSGRLGPRSAVMPWVDTDDDPSPGSAESNGHLIEIGNARLEVRNGVIGMTVGPAELTITSSAIFIRAANVFVEGQGLKHNNINVGDSHTHTLVVPGGGVSGPPP